MSVAQEIAALEAPVPAPLALRVYYVSWAIPGVILLGVGAVSAWRDLVSLEVLVWFLVLVVVESLPVTTWADSTFSLTDPLVVAFAVLFPPGLAYAAWFVAAQDPREWRRQVSIDRALFNRTQTALGVASASFVYRLSMGDHEGWPIALASVTLAAAAFYVLNMVAVGWAFRIERGIRVLEAVRRMLLGAPLASIMSYLSFGWLGLLIAKLYAEGGGGWVVVTAGLPLLILARRTFLQIGALQKEADAARQRETVLRELSRESAREREDERRNIAAALHDDVIPLLQAINVTSLAALGSAPSESEDFQRIREMSSEALEEVRRNVSELRESSLGAGGLGPALAQIARDSAIPVGSDVGTIRSMLHPAAELVIYQVAREAVRNANQHSGANMIHLSLREVGEAIELTVADDGRGFHSESKLGEHFGLLLMQERAAGLAGRVVLTSSPTGTLVALRLPIEIPDSPGDTHTRASRC